jgi:hypothetical protein
LGIGDWAQSPIPNPQSPIPNPQLMALSLQLIKQIYFYLNLNFKLKMGCQEMKEKKKTPLNQKGSTNKIESQNKILDSNGPQKAKNEPNITEGLSQNKLNNQEHPQSNPPENNTPFNTNNIENPESNIVVSGSLANLNKEKSTNDLLRNRSIERQSEIEENNKLNISDKEYIPSHIGKLCFDPILLFVYDSKKNSFHVQKYDQVLIDLSKLNQTSSCCNGNNKLFISGGIDENNKIVDKLWIFDLVDYMVEEPIQIYPKNGHSMIYIPDQYIFLVGGNDENTFYLNIKDLKVENWANLNKKRIEPALIQVNNFLYVFDNVNKNEEINDFEITFEKTNLLSSRPTWELIRPNLATEILGTKIIPKFFGVAKESEEDIIFLGGNILDEHDNLEDIKNYKYNIEKNLIEFSEVPFANIQLTEKKFHSFNNKNDIFFILPDFYRKCPQVVFYLKNKNIIKIIDYMPNNKVEKKKLDINVKYDINFENENFKYNFNMPKIVEKNEIYKII